MVVKYLFYGVSDIFIGRILRAEFTDASPLSSTIYQQNIFVYVSKKRNILAPPETRGVAD